MAGTRYAVLVGNGSFPGQDGTALLPTLRCPAGDVADLKELLEQSSHGGYAVTTLIDRPHNEIRRGLYDCLKRAGPDDQVLIYYSGHGKLDEQGNLYLAGCDTDPGSLDPTAMAASALQKYVADSRAGARIVILDCCFSGAVERVFRHGTTKGEIAEQASQALRAQAGQGVFYLTASTDTQTAEEKDEDRNSLLTKHILDGIGSGAADTDDDGAVRFSELCSFVQRAIRGEGTQRPLSFALEAYGDPVVAFTGNSALAERRNEIEQLVYELRRTRMLGGPDAARILEYVYRDTADRAAIRTLHAASGDNAAFLRTVFRLLELPDVTAQAAGLMRAGQAAATSTTRRATPEAAGVRWAEASPVPSAEAVPVVRPAEAASAHSTEAAPAHSTEAAPMRSTEAAPLSSAAAAVRTAEVAPAGSADSGPSSSAAAAVRSAAAARRREPATARPRSSWSKRLLAGYLLAWFLLGRRAVVVSLVVAAVAMLGVWWIFRPSDQSAGVAATARPAATVSLAPTANGPTISYQTDQAANTARQATPGANPAAPSLVTGPRSLVNGVPQPLFRQAK